MPDFEPGHPVILKEVPVALWSDLPDEDQAAIKAKVGKAVTFIGMSFGQAEVEFTDNRGDDHTIWVDPICLRAA